MNTYGPSTWKVQVDTKKLTLMLNVDDMLLSHIKAKIVIECIKMLDRMYGLVDPLTETRGKT